jgi:hypothetical protein
MSSQQESTAVTVARAHVAAWGAHNYDAARGALAPDVHVIASSVDQNTPHVDTTGVDEYMEGLIQFGQAVLPGKTRVISALGDATRAMVQVSSRVQFGRDAPEMTLHGVRLYLLDESQKIIEERVIFFVSPE